MGNEKKCDRDAPDKPDHVSRDEDAESDDERNDQSEALDSFLTAIPLTPLDILPPVGKEPEEKD